MSRLAAPPPFATPAPAPRHVPPAFTPVPVRARRDGWTPERQLAFIAALHATRSVTQACRLVGKSPEAAYELRRRSGAESFSAAWSAAMRRPKPPRPQPPHTRASASSTSVSRPRVADPSGSSTSASEWHVSGSSGSSTSDPSTSAPAAPPPDTPPAVRKPLPPYSLEGFLRVASRSGLRIRDQGKRP